MGIFVNKLFVDLHVFKVMLFILSTTPCFCTKNRRVRRYQHWLMKRHIDVSFLSKVFCY